MPRSNDPSLLHPAFRERVLALSADLAAASVPLYLYEAFRSPERQAQLYAQGRSTGERGKTVTKAPSWFSFHQFGLAADFVFLADGVWSWREPQAGMWSRYDELARMRGLHRLSFEQPHVELDSVHLSQLQAGLYPSGGDDGWAWNLEAAIERWGPQARAIDGLMYAGAPPWKSDRPALDDETTPAVG